MTDLNPRGNTMLLKDKVVLVTGGARGIGAAICRVLAREGAKVAINCSHSTEKAEAVAREVREIGSEAEVFCCDVRDADCVNNMVNDIKARFGRLDAVVNNAIAGRQGGKLDEATWEDYANSFDFGAKAVLNTIKAARPMMKAQGGGRIINIVSEQWDFGLAEWSVYLAGKGAMVGISRCLADELGPENITINMIAPGWMRTEKVTADVDTSGYEKSVPLRRQGDAQEIGKVCVFLISHLGDYVTGAYIPVAGGKVRQK